MEKYLLTLLLFICLLMQLPLHTGSLYWFLFLILAYVFTFPGGPVQSIRLRLAERQQASTTPCSHCQKQINAQDVMCASCKLELSLRGNHWN
jgi:hypothetical protein